MKKIIKKSHNIFSKIGKRNIALFFVILIFLVIIRLYNTFSLYTEVSENIVNGIRTYEFILNNNKEDNSVTISDNSSKNISIKISNPDNTKLKYGLYYSSDDALTDVYLGYKKESKREAKGLIDGKENYVVDLKIINLSSHTVTINFGITYGLEKGGEVTLPDGKEWVDKYNGPILLTEMKIGSYVFYEGNNGCDKSSCNGTNINYTNETSKGSCFKSNNTFKTSGWRLAYIKKDTPYLISAGSLKCIASDKDGNISIDETNNYDNSLGLSKHITNLNKESQKYCNRKYAYSNTCNNRSSWAMDVNDFKNITNQVLSSDKCFKQKDNKNCGFENDLIDNGSYYWIANSNNGNNNTMFYWDATEKYINSSTSNYSLGLRPIIRLNDSVYVIEGKGTEQEPYLLDTFKDIEQEEDNTEATDSKNIQTIKIADYIKNKYQDTKEIESINIGNSNSIQVKVNKDNFIMLDNNNIYRYYGEKPNNYVMFNDELWRIISLSNVKSNKEDTIGKERIKLIKATSIGKYSYDSTSIEENEGHGLNNWPKASLMTELNDLYYNGTKGKCYNGENKKNIDCDFSIIGFDSNARYLIDDAVYYLTNDEYKMPNVYAYDYYKNERTTTTWIGKVGLIYGSDYMYAADLNLCKEMKDGYKNNDNCNSNWLYKMHNNVISNLEIENASTPRAVYPTVYLKDNILITEGIGTKDDPFILKIEE